MTLEKIGESLIDVGINYEAKAEGVGWQLDEKKIEADRSSLLARLRAADAVIEAAERWAGTHPDANEGELNRAAENSLVDALAAWREVNK